MTKLDEFLAIALTTVACILSYNIGKNVHKNKLRAYLIEECRAVPWEHRPPVRPTCEDMTELYLEKIASGHE